MNPVYSLCRKAVQIGPVPYLLLSVAIMALGVVMQLRAGAVVVGDGSTVFGLFARIGGFVGLAGLVVLVLNELVDEVSEDADADRAEPQGDVMTASIQDVVVEQKPSRIAPHVGKLLHLVRIGARFKGLSLPRMRSDL